MASSTFSSSRPTRAQGVSLRSDIPIRDIESIQRFQAMEEKILSREEEEELIRTWKDQGDTQAGIQARERLVLCHQKLLVGMARRFERYGVSFQDLYQEGIIGLLNAAERFEPEKGFRFNTFAQWPVLSAMQELAQGSNPVRIGKGRKEKQVFRLILQARAHTGGRLGSEHYDLISEACSMRREDVEAIAEASGSRGLSLNQPVSGADDEGMQFLDTLADNGRSAAQMQDAPLRDSMARVVQEILEELDDRERRVVVERFLSNGSRTLRDLAVEMEISAERVRQICRDALFRMKRILEERGYRAEDILPDSLG